MANEILIDIHDVTWNMIDVHATSGIGACDIWEASLNGMSGPWSSMAVDLDHLGAEIEFGSLSPNTQYDVVVRARNEQTQEYYRSDDYLVTTLGASDITDATDTDIGEDCAIKWTPLSDTFKYKLKFDFFDWSYTTDFIEPAVTTEYTYVGYTFPMSLCNLLPDSVEDTAMVTLTTYTSDGTQIGSASTAEFLLKVPASVVPSIDDITSEDIGQSVFSDLIIQNVSAFKHDMRISGAYGSTPVSVSAWIGTQSWSADVEAGEAEIVTDVITGSGTVASGFSVTDSRGRTYTNSGTDVITPYEFPAVDGSLTYTDTTVTLKFSGKISPVNNRNAKHVTIKRTDLSDLTEVTIFDQDMADYEFSQTVIDREAEHLDRHNYRYDILLVDSIDEDLAEVFVHPGRLYRFDDLDETKYYIGFDETGWKVPEISGTVEDDKVIVERTDGEDPTGIGFPMRMEPGKAYELIYGGDIDDAAYVFISFFAEDYTFLGSYDYDKKIPIGTNVVAPKNTAWGVLVLGIKGAGTKEFSSIALREWLDPQEEEIEWFLETGHLGLDTPNQKYISRIQLRIDYKGTLKIEVAYDNDEEFSTVHESECDHMRSITVPIRVKRNDHFRIRLSGVGQMRLYSFGYDTDDGGARCLI